MTEITELSKKQESAIVAFMTLSTVREVSKQVKVSEVTLYRWLNDEKFQAHYRLARRKVMQQALTHLQRVAGQAVITLAEVMESGESSAPARVAAARSILDLAIKAVEVEDLAQRIEELEKLCREREAEK